MADIESIPGGWEFFEDTSDARDGDPAIEMFTKELADDDRNEIIVTHYFRDNTWTVRYANEPDNEIRLNATAQLDALMEAEARSTK